MKPSNMIEVTMMPEDKLAIDNFIKKYNILEKREYIAKLSVEDNLFAYKQWVSFQHIRDASWEEMDYVKNKIGTEKLDEIISEYKLFMGTLPHVLKAKEKKENRRSIAKRRDNKKKKESWKNNK